MSSIKVLCIGDVVGEPGREVLTKVLPRIKLAEKPDLVVVNAENAAGGVGIELGTAQTIREAGADIITLGDHTFQRKEAQELLKKHSEWCVRPANYPDGAPGRGWAVFTTSSGIKIAVFNLLGRVFINSPLDCPFRKAEELLSGALADVKLRVLDMHAEATSEKLAMARHLDGRIALQVGTHTHVQTADEQIFPGGTGYISDLGMTGSMDGVIGMASDVALARFLTGRPHAYKVAAGAGVIHGVLAELDPETARTISIRRVRQGLDGVS